ncbi:MAG: metalloregulator ArsR/SmtB family transcription factor [Ignavibacteriales bacterium]|nr:metalloregulator ArsR/SmtB family transcription factor [Ignavibacteriales bacterium]
MKNLSKIFKTLSDESRLRIYYLILASDELCVCDIEKTLRFSQTKVSRHLSYLRKAGLVKYRKQGLWMLYSIAESQSAEQRQLLQSIAAGLKANPVAQRDTQLLAKNIQRGCCTTYSVLKPHLMPALVGAQ